MGCAGPAIAAKIGHADAKAVTDSVGNLDIGTLSTRALERTLEVAQAKRTRRSTA